MTLYEIKTAAANYLERTVAELTVNGQDLFLVAANQARREIEQAYDFEFNRKLMSLSVNGTTGGSLSSAVLYGTATAANIKSIVEVGLFDEDANLRPVTWTTVAESLERQRGENKRTAPRYPTDGWYQSGPCGEARFEFVNGTVYRWPRDTSNNFTLGLEVYTTADDWDSDDLATPGTITISEGIPTVSPATALGTYTWVGTLNGSAFYIKFGTTPYALFYSLTYGGWVIQAFTATPPTLAAAYWGQVNSGPTTPAQSYGVAAGAYTGTPTVAVTSASTSDTWTTYGAQYILWQSIVHLNHLFKGFVFRQEGNLPPPKELALAGLESLKEWDSGKFETFRRHNR